MYGGSPPSMPRTYFITVRSRCSLLSCL